MFKRKSECQKLKGVLSPYIDGQLSPSERERTERHLKGCEACRRELESLRATVNLLHRVPMVSPSRSFALELAPKRRPAAFGALRAATAVAMLLLAFLFLGDALHIFGPGLVGEERLFDAAEVAYAGAGFAWPVWQIELALLTVVLVLATVTAILWWRGRRGGEKAQKS
jgi:anti-sigma factor RsiW